VANASAGGSSSSTTAPASIFGFPEPQDDRSQPQPTTKSNPMIAVLRRMMGLLLEASLLVQV
jgi:hypothetical protein